MQQAHLYAMWVMALLMIITNIVLINEVKKIHRRKLGFAPGLKLPAIKMGKNRDIRLTDILSQHPSTFVCVVSIHCTFCREIVAELEKMKQDNPAMNLVYLVTGDDIAEDVENWIQARIQYAPAYGIETTDVMKKLKVNSFPFGMLLNRQGIVLKKGSLVKNELSRWVNELPEVS